LDQLKQNSYVYREGVEEQPGKIKCGILIHDNDRLEYIARTEEAISRFRESRGDVK
jgi:hypothetical protein